MDRIESECGGKALRRDQPGLPILYMSGYSNELLSSRRVEGRDLPVVPKPFAPEQLRDVVARRAAAGRLSGGTMPRSSLVLKKNSRASPRSWPSGDSGRPRACEP